MAYGGQKAPPFEKGGKGKAKKKPKGKGKAPAAEPGEKKLPPWLKGEEVTELVGTARVGSTPVMVLGPLDRDILVQNQSAQKMLVWLDEELEVGIELGPFQRIMAPAGSEMVTAAAPMARPGQAYRLFYSPVVAPGVTVTQG